MEYEEEILVGKVCEIYEEISKLESLKPSNLVNSLFTKLVVACIPSCPIDVTNLPNKVKDIRSKLIALCGEAEGLLESHYATLLASFEHPIDHIDIFPYHSNYLKLSRLEFEMLAQNLAKVPKKIAFVGSGPLPLTSIVLALNHLKSSVFHNYDIDPIANSKASRLVFSHPDLSRRMFFHTADVMDLSSDVLKDYDVVFLAALVGLSKDEKARIIDHLAKNMASGALLLVRSAHGARVFLYPVIEPSDLLGFDALSVYHPNDEVINSIIVARKRPVQVMLPSKCFEANGFISNPLNIIEELTVDDKSS